MRHPTTSLLPLPLLLLLTLLHLATAQNTPTPSTDPIRLPPLRGAPGGISAGIPAVIEPRRNEIEARAQRPPASPPTTPVAGAVAGETQKANPQNQFLPIRIGPIRIPITIGLGKRVQQGQPQEQQQQPQPEPTLRPRRRRRLQPRKDPVDELDAEVEGDDDSDGKDEPVRLDAEIAALQKPGDLEDDPRGGRGKAAETTPSVKLDDGLTQGGGGKGHGKANDDHDKEDSSEDGPRETQSVGDDNSHDDNHDDHRGNDKDEDDDKDDDKDEEDGPNRPTEPSTSVPSSATTTALPLLDIAAPPINLDIDVNVDIPSTEGAVGASQSPASATATAQVEISPILNSHLDLDVDTEQLTSVAPGSSPTPTTRERTLDYLRSRPGPQTVTPQAPQATVEVVAEKKAPESTQPVGDDVSAGDAAQPVDAAAPTPSSSNPIATPAFLGAQQDKIIVTSESTASDSDDLSSSTTTTTTAQQTADEKATTHVSEIIGFVVCAVVIAGIAVFVVRWWRIRSARRFRRLPTTTLPHPYAATTSTPFHTTSESLSTTSDRDPWAQPPMMRPVEPSEWDHAEIGVPRG